MCQTSLFLKGLITHNFTHLLLTNFTMTLEIHATLLEFSRQKRRQLASVWSLHVLAVSSVRVLVLPSIVQKTFSEANWLL